MITRIIVYEILHHSMGKSSLQSLVTEVVQL